MKLNEEQKKVVYSNEPFLFLLAGAGSGKTRVVVERIKYLIEQGVNPEEILAITFTRKASFEMKERIDHPRVNVHTFHQFCYIKLIDYYKETFKLVNEDIEPFSREELLEISKHKNSLYLSKRPNKFIEYQNYLKKNGLKDFDDLILGIYFKIKGKNHPFMYQYIFIDEFQDTNHLQYSLLKELIKKDTKVLAVGDPDQSIYSFRGANSKIIFLYVFDYQAKLYTLSINYRSAKTILEHANRLIKRNNRKYKKELTPTNIENSNVYNLHFSSEKEEAFLITNLIKLFKKHSIQDEEIAILYRNHHRAFELIHMLHYSDIPFQTYDDSNEEKKTGIQLLTIHKAKGLEFDAVIILGLEQGVLPSYRNQMHIELEEERRLMFVAMTRARHFLYFSSIEKNSDNHTFTSSQFISESGTKTIPGRRINDIISLGDFNGRKAKNSRSDSNH
ncbi:MAG: ATP-dependent helicase [Acholeplasmataceae bacterium]|nr:ATP-dependent helicase [Acholeplasmataceae bacterium]